MLLKKKLNCILLIDDDPDDNFFHQVVIKQMDIVNRIDIANDGLEALTYLKGKIQLRLNLFFRYQYAQDEWLGIPGGI